MKAGNGMEGQHPCSRRCTSSLSRSKANGRRVHARTIPAWERPENPSRHDDSVHVASAWKRPKHPCLHDDFVHVISSWEKPEHPSPHDDFVHAPRSWEWPEHSYPHDDFVHVTIAREWPKHPRLTGHFVHVASKQHFHEAARSSDDAHPMTLIRWHLESLRVTWLALETGQKTVTRFWFKDATAGLGQKARFRCACHTSYIPLTQSLTFLP